MSGIAANHTRIMPTIKSMYIINYVHSIFNTKYVLDISNTE
jgi:hypothetical protein